MRWHNAVMMKHHLMFMKDDAGVIGIRIHQDGANYLIRLVNHSTMEVTDLDITSHRTYRRASYIIRDAYHEFKHAQLW